MHTKSTIHKFFTISNLIEGIDDNKEVQRQVEFFYKWMTYWATPAFMFAFHHSLHHLNDYCKPGELRTYDVFVGGRKCMPPGDIENALGLLFREIPRTYKQIKQWHIKFERIHPFGDGNGRTGRFLMLRQLILNGVSIPPILLSIKNFEENRKKYYRWF